MGPHHDHGQADEPAPAEDEYGRTEPVANYLVHVYEDKKFKRTIDRPFTPEDAEAFATEFVLKLLKKRLFSSPEAFRITLEKHADSVRSGKTRKPTVTRPNLSVLRREVDSAEEDAADDDAFEDRNLEAVTATSTGRSGMGVVRSRRATS